jgi:hypothetical protein
MTLLELRACLENIGVRLSARGDKLHFVAPSGVMTPTIKAALLDHKPALLASLARAKGPDSCPSTTAPPPAPDPGPARATETIVTRATATSDRDLAHRYAPREPDAWRRYRLRIDSPLWPADAAADDYRLATRLATLHARGPGAYRHQWTAEDQALADRVRSRNGQP